MTLANVHELPCKPDFETMLAVVRRLFEHTGNLDGLVEIGSTDPRLGLKPPHPLNAGRKFRLADLDLAVEHAASLNAQPNCNVYLSAGVCRVGTYEHSRASDADVDHLVACWVDLDAPGSLANAINAAESMALRPNLITFTGNHPHTRGQMWWVFDEPCADLELHRRLQVALAAKFNGDVTVVNPSRVMRFAGSVAWPIKAERQLEMTGIVEGAEVRGEPYGLQEFTIKMKRFGGMGEAQPAKVRSVPSNVLDFSTAEPTHDLDSLIKRAAEPSQWHRHALLATAHLLGRGTPPDVVLEVLTPRLMQPGFTYQDTRNELVVMVEGALRRGLYHEAPRAAPAQPSYMPAQPQALKANPFVSIAQLLELPPPEWIVEGLLLETGTSGLFGPPGSYKSFVALDLALSMAYGVPFHGLVVKQRRVLYICAEGQYGFGIRGLVWSTHRAAEMPPTENFHVLPVPVNFLDPGCVEQLMQAIADHGVKFDVIMIDTLARNFGAGDENSTKDMNAFVDGITKLARMPAQVLVVHHVGKDASKDERGSSAFRGALDTAIRLDREDGSNRVKVSIKKQKDAEEAPPFNLVVVKAEAVHPLTGEIVTSLLPVIDDRAVEAQASSAAREGLRLTRRQREALEAIDLGHTTCSAIATYHGVDKSNQRRTLTGLVSLGLLTMDAAGEYRKTEVILE